MVLMLGAKLKAIVWKWKGEKLSTIPKSNDVNRYFSIQQENTDSYKTAQSFFFCMCVQDRVSRFFQMVKIRNIYQVNARYSDNLIVNFSKGLLLNSEREKTSYFRKKKKNQYKFKGICHRFHNQPHPIRQLYLARVFLQSLV